MIVRIQQKDPLLKAKDLMEAGITPGIQMGQLLQEAERISINEAVECKKTLLNKLQSSPYWANQE